MPDIVYLREDGSKRDAFCFRIRSNQRAASGSRLKKAVLDIVRRPSLL